MVIISTHSPSTESAMEPRGVSKIFRTADYVNCTMLEGLDLNLRQGEIVVMLNRSGLDKSTLLRVMAGLMRADRGQVLSRGREYSGSVQGAAMVFQSFVLFPWLTVQQNAELGLEAQDMPKVEREERVEQAVDLIDLPGLNSALPRELSDGMRQRVGIARALVTEPDLLPMDEASSAFDVLTDENLRDEVPDL